MKRRAWLMATFATMLWSGSYIVNQLAFQEGVGPLTLSGLRYVLAALLLLLLRRLHPPQKAADGSMQKLSAWLTVLLGLLGYAAAQGLQYIGQTYLTPTQSSLLLSVGNTSMVLLVDWCWLRENRTRGDAVKLLLLVGGIALYDYPWAAEGFSPAGIAFMALSSVAYAVHMTLNRHLLRHSGVQPSSLVARPMLIGGAALLLCGLYAEGFPRLSWGLGASLLYLSGVSGALGFSLWTASQAGLTAFESSGINNLMLVEIALLDLAVFNRVPSLPQGVAIAVVFAAIVLIQRRRAG